MFNVFVLQTNLLYGLLYVLHFAFIWFYFLEFHVMFLQEIQKGQFRLVQKKNCFSACRESSRSSDSMNVCFYVIWTVVLNDPLNLRNVESSRRNVSGNQNAAFLLFESKKNGSSFSLRLSSVILE